MGTEVKPEVAAVEDRKVIVGTDKNSGAPIYGKERVIIYKTFRATKGTQQVVINSSMIADYRARGFTVEGV